MPTSEHRPDALVIGAGPAGLMAADVLSAAGSKVLLVDAKPSFGRKLLMAGKSGLNLTREQPAEAFWRAYSDADWLLPVLRGFGPQDVQDWARNLGQELFTGSSGRVFPKAMKASPLLRAWLGRLAGQGVEMRVRWRWQGWEGDAALFDTPDGKQAVQACVCVLALGGGSWARLGSDGAWVRHLSGKGVEIAPFRPSNIGFDVDWSPHMARLAGQPVKPVRIALGPHSLRGEFVITGTGIEGGAIYALSRHILSAGPGATVLLDLMPDLSRDAIAAKLGQPRGKLSLGNHLRKAIGLTGARAALLHELSGAKEPQAIATALKALPLRLTRPRPIDEAISTAGGVSAAALDENLMLKAVRGTFCAGEMLDWDAPTGGYLLTACLATGRHAGLAAARYIAGLSKDTAP